MFNKYETYSTVDSKYCYRETNVLRNKLQITDGKLLRKAEEEITALKQAQMIISPVRGRFTKTHLFNIHRCMFQDIYNFAGQVRKEQIGKGGSWFYPPAMITAELDKNFELIKKHKQFTLLNDEEFFDKLAYIMAELNAVHPFREGNGRTIREFVRLLANHNGYILNWGNVSPEKILDASISSMDDYKILIDVLKKCSE